MKDVVQPMEPVLIKTLLFLFRPRELSRLPDAPNTDVPTMTDMDTSKLTDIDTQAVEGWRGLFQLIVGWGLFGIIGMVFLGVLVCILIYSLRLLLKRSRDDSVLPLSAGWILGFLRKLVSLPLLIWRGWLSLLKGVDCAAMAYAGMLRWGKRSGMALILSETPAEYGNRLMNAFPGLGAEIELIVEAFNKEVYGLSTTDRQLFSRLRSAQRRMKRLRYWSSRMKVWFSQ